MVDKAPCGETVPFGMANVIFGNMEKCTPFNKLRNGWLCGESNSSKSWFILCPRCKKVLGYDW